jgi:transposase
MTDTTPARMIAFIQQPYDVERAAAELTPDGRHALRQERLWRGWPRSTPERARLTPIVLPKSPAGDGLRYLTNQRTGLQRFVEDGRLAVDHNRAENQLRIFALGRKNWLFAGSFEGARRAALLYSLVQSCKLIDVPPFAYLKDVLLRVATHPHRLIA